MEPLESEGRPGTVSDEPFDALPVITLDADRSVNAEPAGALPSEHAVRIGLVEETVGAEVPEDTALDDALEVEPVMGLKPGGFMEPGLTDGSPREHAVEDDHVIVEVPVEGGAEPVQEADGPELGIPGRAGARVAQGGSDGPKEDLQDGTGDVRVVVQEGAQPLGKAEHPLAQG
jgi:hypothetical protein